MYVTTVDQFSRSKIEMKCFSYPGVVIIIIKFGIFLDENQTLVWVLGPLHFCFRIFSFHCI